MDNIEERAKEWCNSIINRLDTSDLYRGYVQGAVEERAEFKEYLEKRLCDAKSVYEMSHHEDYVGGFMDAINEIINELFGEE